MGCHTPPLEKAKQQGKRHTQPQSHPIPKFYIFKWDGLRLVTAFPLVSLLFLEVEYDMPSLNPFYF